MVDSSYETESGERRDDAGYLWGEDFPVIPYRFKKQHGSSFLSYF
jgi:hypothetical protein